MAEREKPPEGGKWPNNGEVYEKSRVWHESMAETCEAAGDPPKKAAEWRILAAENRRQRDRCYSEQQRRMMNRRVWRGTS